MTRTARLIWNELMPRRAVFATADVVALSDMAPSNVSRDLARLAADGMISRIRRGLWAIAGHPDFSPYAVVPHLFAEGEEGYVSLLSAMSLHGMIDQIPQAVQIVTTKQRAPLSTSVARYEFHQIQPELFGGAMPYGGTGTFDIASPEKALFDILYLSTRKGNRFAHLPETEMGKAFSYSAMEAWIAKVRLEPLCRALRERWDSIGAGEGPARS
ncbi:MAG: type IV toxin-antitoxin system AbiEi family antitoxin [Longimicrobiales bacterium]|nr:type IV toxin-antitoxin system AbiEi family antitoxin [Longimicrobiales bacterium]